MMLRYNSDYLSRVCELWGVGFLRPRTDLPLAGSPERCEFRMVVEDRDQHLYILENIAPYQEDFWQLSPYVDGVELQRPDYVHEGWRGRVLAAFLLELSDKSREIPNFDALQPFSIITFIDDFMLRLKTHDPRISSRVQHAYSYLKERLQPVHDLFPISFCHGDLHPLNVIWSADDMRAVIDWEFLGYKAEAYDAANLIGCLGMELPQGLTGDLAFEFIQSLRQTAYLSKTSWKFLFEMVLALRFAWLSEWLHRNDPEMVELEMVYMGMLLENRDLLLRSWGMET